MLLPGQTLLVVEVVPALFAAVAANAAERVAPGNTLVTVSMIGAAGRVYLAGATPDIVRARDEITRVLRGRGGARARSRRATEARRDDERDRRQERIDDLAQAALARFGLPPEATAALCNVSENHTYRVDDPADRARLRAARAPRPATAPRRRSSPSCSGSTRCAATAPSTPACPCRAPGGERVVAGLGGRARQPQRRRCSSGCPAASRIPRATEAIAGFRTLGAVSARMHAHARAWPRPQGFDRPAGTTSTRSAPRGHWGRWQDGLGMGAEERALLERLDATIAARLEAYGQAARPLRPRPRRHPPRQPAGRRAARCA